MENNTIIAIVVVVIIAAVLIIGGILMDKSRKRAIRRADEAAKAKADERLAAERAVKAAEAKTKQAEAEEAEAQAQAAKQSPVATNTAAQAPPTQAAETATKAGTGELPPAQPSASPTPSEEGVKEESASTPSAEGVGESEARAGGSPRAVEEVPVPANEQIEKPAGRKTRLETLRAKLSKSSNPFGKALFTILTKDNLTESDWEDVEDTLLMADVGAEASEELTEKMRTDARVTGKSNPAEVKEALRGELVAMVGKDTDRRLNADKPDAHRPSVIIMVGVNGTGKTTTAGKLARLFVGQGKSVMLGAADTFRAAAADQLETWGAKVGVPVVRSDRDSADPASVAFEASQKAKEADVDVLIIDTAGRLQNKANLMDELGKIRRVTEKNLPVDEVLLVLDATTGQNGMAQAKVFAEAIGITGVVLTKLDGSAKGGIVISVQKELGVPVKLVGVGEGPDDLAPFEPAAFVDGILE
ncbi:signal recognition particle-docking protein FtsY [Bifidobacterium choloepi]|uniref:Signal recognition particle receptor FtsY n=1 Tax=Bifidobacterium choloepi TaxID=2614131 RepID=A0A6I5NM97_9BIFI|nr:signal recognition particle-docking protein FtsY [Bifidobacterium choloepi]NEG69862.1 signal recognition particle-docking protein FtsY [Bifidobacterium choloepi]